MHGFTKLFNEIITSSIWSEDDKTRIVWVTMLASCDALGVVRASVSGLAHIARVNKESCLRALEVLSSPDSDSRSSEFEGRRIDKVDGGWVILNHTKYRNARNADERKSYMVKYMREYRAKHSVNSHVNNNKQSKPQLAKAEAEADNVLCGGTTTGGITPDDFDLANMSTEDRVAELQRNFPDIDIHSEFEKLKKRCSQSNTTPTIRSFIGWLKKASPKADISKPKKTNHHTTNHSYLQMEEIQ